MLLHAAVLNIGHLFISTAKSSMHAHSKQPLFMSPFAATEMLSSQPEWEGYIAQKCLSYNDPENFGMMPCLVSLHQGAEEESSSV